jgi:hypothetical protein
MVMCGENLKKVNIELEGRVIEQVTEFMYLGTMICKSEPDTGIKMHKYNTLNRMKKDTLTSKYQNTQTAINPQHYSESQTPLQSKLRIKTRTQMIRDSTNALPKNTPSCNTMTGKVMLT